MSLDPASDTHVTIGIDAIIDSPPVVVDVAAAENAAEERAWLENERIRSQVEDLHQDRDERRKYAHRVFCMMAGWLTAMLLIVVAYGTKVPALQAYVGFEIPQAVVITLVTTTTASVVGIFLIIASYLFPKR